ncbi:MAG TPA: hypothetical protein VE153_37210 [Myxococcus sp.]|nr:hypothetical protein [Myxococcus sp.]
MGRVIELIAETFGAFGVAGVCTVVGGIALVVVLKSAFRGK